MYQTGSKVCALINLQITIFNVWNQTGPKFKRKRLCQKKTPPPSSQYQLYVDITTPFTHNQGRHNITQFQMKKM